MALVKAPLKLGMSWSSRKLRLGVTHSGTPSSYILPVKDPVPTAARPQQPKKRR